MSNSIIQWLMTPPEDRQRAQDVSLIRRQGSQAQAQIEEIGDATAFSEYQLAKINHTRRVADQVAPGSEELSAMLAVAGTVAMAEVIARMSRMGRYRS